MIDLPPVIQARHPRIVEGTVKSPITILVKEYTACTTSPLQVEVEVGSELGVATPAADRKMAMASGDHDATVRSSKEFECITGFEPNAETRHE
ncbi:hypothetical protein AAE478_009415 [Parahypoxylon ruwenzoriense]